MKKIVTLLFVMGLCIPFLSTSSDAQCTDPYGFGSSYYHYVQGLPDGAPGANWDTIFYAYNSNPTGVFSHNGGYTSWWINLFGVWYAGGDWATSGVTACPPLGIADHTIQIISYDADLGTAFNPVSFSVLGAGWSGSAAKYDFDAITDALPSPFGGPNNCMTPLRPIPIVGVSSIDCAVPPCQATLSWTDPSPASYGTTGHPEYMYGYQVYYTTVPYVDPLTDDPGTNSGWTATGAPVALGAGGAVVDGPASMQGFTVFFALGVIGAGVDNSGPGVGPTAFQTAFSGQASPGLGVSPAAIELLSFSAASGIGKASITWETGSEVDTAGFNIYRATEVNGRKVKVNDSLIPAQGGPASGASYELVDNGVTAHQKYFYILEEIETDNDHNLYGPVSVTINGRIAPRLSN